MRKIVSLSLIFSFVAFSASAQSSMSAKLNELRALPIPKQQNDLDTMKIVSVKREVALSTEERTSGLWQSWLVSVCNGCGRNQRTVAEIDAAANSYKRPGDDLLLGRPVPLELTENADQPQTSKHRGSRVRFSELSVQGYGRPFLHP